MELSSIGLSVIVLAWLVQLFYSWKGNKDIKPLFLLLYIIGVAVLVVNGLVNGGKNPWMDLASLIAALLVLMRTGRKKGR
ncbi:hypothetical protein J4433_00285 [Candidatus Pacearchaeota archaeon]|nr:hypothetical protein [Candidatus Pacearchaeota archaeon]